jgi:prepilin-type processing-associated H-X9-DG protein
MYCDWQAPKYSYIPNYNLMPAHDWVPVSMTVLPDPANTIAVTERRDKSPRGTLIGKHKGVTGFNPSQPCPGSTLVPPQYASLAGTNTYAYYTQDLAEQHLANDTNDKNDLIRVMWSRHGEGANYSYADGHARWQRLGQTLKPDAYQYGDRFYPGYAGYNVAPCN